MKKSKLKKQIKKLKNVIDALYCKLVDLSVGTANQGIELNEFKAKIDDFKAPKCESHTNLKKMEKVSIAGQESGELEQSVATWFDESTELTEEELKALLERIKTGKLKPHKILFERSPRFIITTNAIDVF